ncbi:MAG: dodecin domain-containing protein [Betaproteobacteria bacterium]
MAPTLAGFAVLWATATVAGELATFRVDPALTSTEFSVTRLGIAKQRGRFESAPGSIVLDPGQAGGSVDFIIDSALKNVRSAWVHDQPVDIEKGKIVGYKAALKVTFVLND